MSLPLHTLLRIAAVLITVVFIFIFQGRVPYSVPWDTFVYALAFSHYYMALVYSGRPMKQAVTVSGWPWKLAGLAALFATLYGNRYSLVIYFGVHHALNETYLLDRVTAQAKEKAIRALRTAGVVLNMAIYLFLLRHHEELAFLSRPALAMAVAAAYVVFLVCLWRAKPLLSRSELIDNTAAEFVSIAALAASLFVEVRFLYIVAYHFVYWALRPLPRLMAMDKPKMWRYLAMTLVFLVGAYAVSPLGIYKYEMANSWFFNSFIFWSYLHITLSFAVSDAHPGWISRFMRGV